jgi:hypothetical protein
MKLYLLLLLLSTNISIFLISQNLLNLLVFIVIYIIITIMFKRFLLKDILLKEKEQLVFLMFLIKLRLFISFYMRYVELELFNVNVIFLELKKIMEQIILNYNWVLERSHKNVTNKAAISILMRILESSSLIEKRLILN